MGKIVIVGGGISGLSLARAILDKDKKADVVVFESEERAGGKAQTENIKGYLCEKGVNGFLDNRPKTLELISKLYLEPLRSSDTARKRYILSDGSLHLLPESPKSFFSSELLSLSGRLRILYELIASKGKDDETIAEFARRRLGREAYEKLIDPMVSGIYAGNPETLSLRSCFPRIHELENRYGSLIRGMIKLQKEAKKTGGAKVSAGPGGVLTSFNSGMSQLINCFTINLGYRLMPENKVVGIDKTSRSYGVYLSNGSIIEADILVIAIPAYAASEILKYLDKKLSTLIGEIQYPPVSVVCFGYERKMVGRHEINGFGFLVPNRERRKILGTLWDSSIFPNRAPEDCALLRTMVGGARAPELAIQDDSKLIDTVYKELKDIMRIYAYPSFVKIYRHEKAIPQYNTGHSNRLKAIDDILLKYKDLYLTGNAYRGIGFNDCIENSYKLADRIFEKEEEK